MSNPTRTIFLGAAALASVPLWAQPPAAAGATLGANPAPAYSSAFDGYRPFEAPDVQDWRKANDTAREIGGWRSYAREIQAGPRGSGPSSPAAPATTPALQPRAADPHRGHDQ